MTRRSGLLNGFRHAAGWLIVFAACATLPAAQQRENNQNNSNDEGCIKCHNPVKVALQKKFNHAAVEKGCFSCHAEHLEISPLAKRQAGANHYLRKGQPELCLECHSNSKQDLAAAHRGQPFSQAQCTGCHDPHGSNAPKLMPEVSHGPSGARQCSTCHVTREGGNLQLVADDMDALCYGCHAEVKNRIEGSKSRHRLLALDHTSCLECHDPHATNQKYLLKKPAHELCSGCHLDLTSGKRYVHGPVEMSCIFCHDPHASDIRGDLRAPGNELCQGCHGSNAARIAYSKQQPFPLFDGKVSLPPNAFESVPFIELSEDGKKGHPLPNHPVSAPASDKKPELTCLACHTPHASAASRQLLNRGKEVLCSACHSK